MRDEPARDAVAKAILAAHEAGHTFRTEAGHEARAEACAVVAGCSIACSAIARTLAADYDTDDPDGTDADELALLVLTIRATRRAALHIQTLAEEATP